MNLDSPPTHPAPSPDSALSVSPPERQEWGRTLVAWVLIVAGIYVFMNLDKWFQETEPSEGQAATEVVHPQPSLNSELVAKLVVGIAPFAGPSQTGFMSIDEGLESGSIYDRLTLVAVQVRLGKLADARARLDQLKQDSRLLESKDDRLAPLVISLGELIDLASRRVSSTNAEVDQNADVTPSDATAPDEAGRARIREVLGWSGEQALVAAGVGGGVKLDDAMVTLISLLVFCAGACLGGLLGTGWLIALAVMAYKGKIRSALSSSTASSSTLAEIFVAWMTLSIGLQVCLALLMGRESRLDNASTAAISSLASLAAVLCIYWGRVRGFSWGQIREWLGLSCGQRLLTEVAIGFLTWMSGIPLLAIGLGIAAVLAGLLGDDLKQAGHPVQAALLSAGVLERVIIFALAALIAPLVEETVFRGALYLHLRRVTGRMGVVVSIGLSALVSSFLFAMIHPQGVAFAPVLAGLAVAFCLAREWRGSLVAPMVAHGLNNATILTLNIMLFA